MKFICHQCRKEADRPAGQINRARRTSGRVFCSRDCSSDFRRLDRPIAERRRLKSEYDAQYREANRQTLKAKKAAYHKESYNPEKARQERKARAPIHAEYCRQPGYRAWKKEYDRIHRAKKEYGAFWEAAVTLFDIEKEVRTRATDYEIRVQNGTLNKALQRKREDARTHRL